MNSSVLLEGIEKTLCVRAVCRGAGENRKAAINPGAAARGDGPQRSGLPVCLQSVALVFAQPLLGSCWKAFLNKNLISFLDQYTNQTVANAAFIFLVDA